MSAQDRQPKSTASKDRSNIPTELRERDQWVVWRRPDKVPLKLDSTRASVTDPTTWTTYERASAAVAAGRFDGVGFVFTEDDPYCGIDLDDCLGEDATIHPDAQAIADLSFSEPSPSGHGVHVILKASKNGRARCKTTDVPWGALEIYDRARFFTMTGEGSGRIVKRQAELEALLERYLPESSSPNGDAPTGEGFQGPDDELVQICRDDHRNGEKFARVYDRGDASDFGGDESSADLFVLGELRYHGGRDPVRMRRVWLESSLMKDGRDKPQKMTRPDYIERTVAKAKCEGASVLDTNEPGHADANGSSGTSPPDEAQEDAELLQELRDAARITNAAEFGAASEPGGAALVGELGDALVVAGSEGVVFGDGGATKTTLMLDFGTHLAAGEDWLEIPVPEPLRVLLIEREGPRAPFRNKVLAKILAWEDAHPNEPVEDRLQVLEKPWPGGTPADGEPPEPKVPPFTFTSVAWRTYIAEQVDEREIDMLIIGPLTAVGMDTAGTIQETRRFVELVADLRERSGRERLMVFLVHHENKAGRVSGAWEGVGDTHFHVSCPAHSKTILKFSKARWGSSYHNETVKLDWAEGESFVVEDERNYAAEIEKLLTTNPWRTEAEIARKTDHPKGGGIGAGRPKVKEALADDHFVSRTGDAAVEVGRDYKATVWNLKAAI